MAPEPSSSESLCFTGADDGERLDRFLSRRLDVARNQVQRWIHEGRVDVDGKKVEKVSFPLQERSQISCRRPKPLTEDPRVTPEDGPLDLLYEDRHVVVLNKPAGLVVHPGAGHATGTLAHRLLHHFPEMTGVGGLGRPGIVHRLDRGTSGVMVVARSAAAYTGLTTAFAERTVKKVYLAVVYGSPKPPTGTVNAPIGRHPERRQEMAVRPRGRSAVTHYRLLEAAREISILRLEIDTGRTHQIRVHLKSLGHPLVGDPTYGERRWKAVSRPRQGVLRDFGRPALHAWKLEFHHPVSGEPLAFTAPLPKDLLGLWEEFTQRPWPGGRGPGDQWKD